MLVNFFLGDFLSLSVPKCTFPVPNSIESGAGKVHFCFVSLSASGLAVRFRTWREVPQSTATKHRHKAPPPTTATNHHHSRAAFADGALARVAVFVRRKLWQLASGS